MTAHHSLLRRVFWTILGVGLITVAVFTVAGTAYLHARATEATRAELRDEAEIVATVLDDAPNDIGVLKQIKLPDTRVTLIDSDGKPIFDNKEDIADMGNHAKRPEVEEALEDGTGSSERASSTLGKGMVYEAVRLQDGGVLRLARAQAGLLDILGTLVGPILVLAVMGAAVALFTARHESRAIIEPLTLVDLDHPRRNADIAYSEMEPMLERIESQRQELKRQMRVLANNDRMRREFTANVTHELKTPLTAISGYAELISSGMVASMADQREFAERIHDEAARLTALVNDILTLSNLDEAEHGGQEGSQTSMEVLGAREPVDLPRLLASVCQRLEPIARKNDVVIGTSCEPAVVVGVPRLLDELAYNLASNAVRYNRAGGSVDLSCGVTEPADGSGPRPFLRVADTGIGIEKGEQDKIFERFYRVDKSRSKARGGTGLGLAIVKHAALYHDATIDLDSELGRGTTITVTFPVQVAVGSGAGEAAAGSAGCDPVADCGAAPGAGGQARRW